MEYLVILLDDTAPSYCAYTVPPRERRLISTEDLKAGITFALKENLRVQFVCPDYALPPEYRALMETVEHSRIQTADCAERGTEVAVFNGWDNLEGYPYAPETAYILRTGKEEFFRQYPQIAGILERVARLNVIITDIETFGEEDFSRYAAALRILSGSVLTLFLQGKRPQLNLLTDRLMLEEMNNCNAGWKNITLAPDGRFYICPAFYYENEPKCVGSLKTGLHIGDAWTHISQGDGDVVQPHVHRGGAAVGVDDHVDFAFIHTNGHPADGIRIIAHFPKRLLDLGGGLPGVGQIPAGDLEGKAQRLHAITLLCCSA